MAATRKGTDDTDFKSLQFFFAPALRPGTDTHTAHRADGTLAQNFAGKGSRALGKVSSAGIKNDVAHPRSRRNRLSGDHHHFPAFRNCQQFRNRCTTDLPGTTEDHCGEILLHQQNLCSDKVRCRSKAERENAYSSRRATIGSTLLARHAGITVAANATRPSN